jgi:hypothetical protein
VDAICWPSSASLSSCGNCSKLSRFVLRLSKNCCMLLSTPETAIGVRFISFVKERWQNCKKWLLASSRLYVRPSVCMEQLGSHRTDFHEYWHLSIFRKSAEKIQVSVHPTRIRGTLRRRVYSYDVIEFFLEWEMFVVQFLLGNSPASVCYWPTFRNALSVPSSSSSTCLWRWNR